MDRLITGKFSNSMNLPLTLLKIEIVNEQQLDKLRKNEQMATWWACPLTVPKIYLAVKERMEKFELAQSYLKQVKIFGIYLNLLKEKGLLYSMEEFNQVRCLIVL